jgi:hypothetical protein
MEDFLREFHHRRVEEAVYGKSSTGLWSRLRTWLAEPGFARWAYGAGVAYAAVLAVMLLMPKGVETAPVASEPVKHEVVMPVDQVVPTQLQEFDLRPSTEGVTGDQEF